MYYIPYAKGEIKLRNARLSVFYNVQTVVVNIQYFASLDGFNTKNNFKTPKTIGVDFQR